jgi:hypothetical protein
MAIDDAEFGRGGDRPSPARRGSLLLQRSGERFQNHTGGVHYGTVHTVCDNCLVCSRTRVIIVYKSDIEGDDLWLIIWVLTTP